MEISAQRVGWLHHSTHAWGTHVVMLGSTRLKDVLVDDVLNHGGIRLTHYPDWDKPLFNREELGLTDQQTCEAA